MKYLLRVLPATLLLTSCQTPIPPSAQDIAIEKAQAEARARQDDYHATADEYNLLEIAKNPNNWANHTLSFDGRVLWIRESDQGTSLQVMNGHTSVVVAWPKSSMPGVVEGSYIGLLGSFVGTIAGTNAFGATVESLNFSAKAWVPKDQYGSFSHFQGPLDPVAEPDGFYIDGEKEAFDQWRRNALR
jgi:hypothetical protein